MRHDIVLTAWEMLKIKTKPVPARGSGELLTDARFATTQLTSGAEILLTVQDAENAEVIRWKFIESGRQGAASRAPTLLQKHSTIH